jgi:hypothetical protein
VPPLVAVGQGGESVGHGEIGTQGLGEVGREIDRARRVIAFKSDRDVVACGDAGGGPGVGAHRDHGLASHHGDGAGVARAVDGDANRDALAAAQRRHDLVGDPDAGRGLAAEQQGVVNSMADLPLSAVAEC